MQFHNLQQKRVKNKVNNFLLFSTSLKFQGKDRVIIHQFFECYIARSKETVVTLEGISNHYSEVDEDV